MATKGAIWIWLTLLAVRGLAVFCIYMHYQAVNTALQEEALSKEMQQEPALQHHYRIHTVHTGQFYFFLLS